MVPHIKEYEKALNHELKIVTFGVQHLNTNYATKMNLGKVNAKDIGWLNIHCIYRDWAGHHLNMRYSVIFVHNNQTQVLQYNTKPKPL